MVDVSYGRFLSHFPKFLSKVCCFYDITFESVYCNSSWIMWLDFVQSNSIPRYFSLSILDKPEVNISSTNVDEYFLSNTPNKLNCSVKSEPYPTKIEWFWQTSTDPQNFLPHLDKWEPVNITGDNTIIKQFLSPDRLTNISQLIITENRVGFFRCVGENKMGSSLYEIPYVATGMFVCLFHLEKKFSTPIIIDKAIFINGFLVHNQWYTVELLLSRTLWYASVTFLIKTDFAIMQILTLSSAQSATRLKKNVFPLILL